MKAKPKVVKVTLLIVALLVAVPCLSYAYWQWDQTKVTVVNRSGQDADAVELSLNNARYALGSIRAGETKSVRIFPHGESVLQMTFFSGHSAVQNTSPQMHIDPAGGSRPELTIDANNGVRGNKAGLSELFH